jgi:hypothetical protein
MHPAMHPCIRYPSLRRLRLAGRDDAAYPELEGRTGHIDQFDGGDKDMEARLLKCFINCIERD